MIAPVCIEYPPLQGIYHSAQLTLTHRLSTLLTSAIERTGMRDFPARLLVAMLAALVPQTALASLGGATATIDADQSRMSVRSHVSAPTTRGAMHTLSLNNGGEVREYTNAAGMIYAVRWNGPGKPDLQALLGVHFTTFQNDNAIRRRHGLRQPPMVNRSDLRVVTGGHPGAFWGYAWLPQSAPAGFDPASL